MPFTVSIRLQGSAEEIADTLVAGMSRQVLPQSLRAQQRIDIIQVHTLETRGDSQLAQGGDRGVGPEKLGRQQGGHRRFLRREIAIVDGQVGLHGIGLVEGYSPPSGDDQRWSVRPLRVEAACAMPLRHRTGQVPSIYGERSPMRATDAGRKYAPGRRR